MSFRDGYVIPKDGYVIPGRLCHSEQSEESLRLAQRPLALLRVTPGKPVTDTFRPATS